MFAHFLQSLAAARNRSVVLDCPSLLLDNGIITFDPEVEADGAKEDTAADGPLFPADYSAVWSAVEDFAPPNSPYSSQSLRRFVHEMKRT